MAYLKLKLSLIMMVILLSSIPTFFSLRFLNWAAQAGGFGDCGWCSQTHPFYIATNQEIANFFNLLLVGGGLTFSSVILLLDFSAKID